MKYSPLLMCFLLGLAACKSSGGGDSKPSTKAKTDTLSNSETDPESAEESSSLKISKRRKVSLEKDFSNMWEFKENINNYIVTLEAETGDYSGATVECRIVSHLVSQDNKTTATFDEAGLKAELVLTIQKYAPTSVDYACKVMDRGSEVDSATIKLRKSIIVPSGKSQNINAVGLGGSQAIESLVLEEGAVLVTAGDIVELKMNEFISDKATIATFAQDNMPKPVDNEPGRWGGEIVIETEKAMGEVSFELRGGNAGQQTEVPRKNPFVYPVDGALNGQCKGVVPEEYFNKNNQLCWGKKGHQGKQGFKGFSGLEGGRTGYLFFKSNQANKLKLSVSFFPGQESKGNIGGAGGEPSAGGIGSTVEVYRERNDHDPVGPRIKSMASSTRYKYPDGARGDLGLQGEAGDSGRPGENETSEIVFGFEEMKYEFNYNFKNY
jgi:hypothetical protein